MGRGTSHRYGFEGGPRNGRFVQVVLHHFIKLSLSLIHPGKNLFVGFNEPHEFSFLAFNGVLNRLEVFVDLVFDLMSIFAHLMVDFVHYGSCDTDSLTVFVPARTAI
jgi:hypothetical protein